MTTPRIIRVFPRKTKATPDDALAYFDVPDALAEADEIHVSITFTYDKPWAEYLAEKWQHVAPVKIGGVAYSDRGEEFIPGRYVKPSYIFTSRGCPRRCWFCSVWKRDPVPRLLPADAASHAFLAIAAGAGDEKRGAGVTLRGTTVVGQWSFPSFSRVDAESAMSAYHAFINRERSASISSFVGSRPNCSRNAAMISGVVFMSPIVHPSF
jgi:hypothetical protein